MDNVRWRALAAPEQFRAIAAEVRRAAEWEAADREKFKELIARAIELTDYSLDDPRWRTKLPMLFGLRNELAKLYVGEGASASALYAAF